VVPPKPVTSCAGGGGGGGGGRGCRCAGAGGPRWPLIRAWVAVIRFSMYNFGIGIPPVDVKSVGVGLIGGFLDRGH
jgi:hypothetical protein